MAKKIGRWLIGGAAIAITAALNFGTIEKNIEHTDKTETQIYTEIKKESQFKTGSTYRYYLADPRIEKMIIDVENNLENLYKGGNGTPNRETRVKWQRNLVAGYRSSENKISRFENEINILDDLARPEINWKEFAGDNKKEFTKRLKTIITVLKTAEYELHQVPVLLNQHLQQKPIQHTLTDIQSNDLNRKIAINQETINESYQLFQWYGTVLLEKIQYWKIMNPNDSIATQSEYEDFIKQLNSINFNVNN